MPNRGTLATIAYVGRSQAATLTFSLIYLLSHACHIDASTIGYWRFENGTANTAATGTNSVIDSSGNNRHGTPRNGPIYRTNVPVATLPQTGLADSLALQFNGSNQYVSIPDNPIFQLTQSLALEAYINLASYPSTEAKIVFRGDNRASNDPYFLSITSSHNVDFHINRGGGSTVLLAPLPGLNQWVHVAGTLDDATGDMRLYINGDLVNSVNTSDRPFGALDSSQSPGLGIGALQTGGQNFNGLIDEVRISNQALRPDQFLSMFPSASGTWITNGNGNWSTPSNWLSGIVASGTDSTADFSTLNITGDRTASLDLNLTIGHLKFADTVPDQRWILAGSNRLTMAVSSGSPTITVTNGSVQITAPIAGNQGLTYSGGGILELYGNNSYTGTTTVSGAEFKFGSDANLGQAPVVATPGSVVIDGGTFAFVGSFALNSNRGILITPTGGKFDVPGGQTITYGGVIDGSGPLNIQGAGTLVLNGTSTHSGSTIISGGTVNVTGSIAQNSSSKVFIVADPDGDFSTAGPTFTRSVTNGASYADFGSSVTSGLLTAADIRAGMNATGIDTGVSMQWRLRETNEMTPTQTTPPIPDTPGGGLVAEVLHLSGMVNSGQNVGQTDSFALQMTYDDAHLAAAEELSLATRGFIYLAWLDPTGFEGSQPFWVNAVSDNFGEGTSVFANYLGSWDSFASAHGVNDTNIDFFLGSWGVDTTNNAVWAIINHQGDFSAVPEPSSHVMGGIGMVLLLVIANRRAKCRLKVACHTNR